MMSGWGRHARAIAVSLAVWLAGSPALAAPRVVVGQPAPPFVLKLFDDSEVSSESLRGKVVVLNYWATWCAPCREELPLLEGFYRLTNQHGLIIYTVATEDSIPPHKLRRALKDVTMPMVRRVKNDYGVMMGVPTNYVIDRAGIVRYAKAGALKLDDLNAILIPLLREPAPATLAAAQ